MNDSFGDKLKITLFGASHSPRLGVTISGVPAGLVLSQEDFMRDILRRKSGAAGTTPRLESDLPCFECGVKLQEDGNLVTDGGQICISFENNDFRPQDYASFKDVPRPGHADFVAFERFGSLLDGYFSGRMTLPVVAAGAIAKKMTAPALIEARLTQIGGLAVAQADKAIAQTAEEGDSIGGIVECRCSGLPVGLGEPFFDSVESLLSHAMFAIPGIRGIEFGDGFAAAAMRGSEHNDPLIDSSGHTSKNGCGGINGGMTNGNELVFRIAVKPTSSISRVQKTFDMSTGTMTEFSVPGRHDVCFALRVPPVVEALTAIVLANLI